MAEKENLNNETREELRNEDPITGAAGAHPVGTGLGTAAGGALTGVAAGAVGGPVGAAVGAVVGGVAGGLAGKVIAEQIDPTVEAAYWRENYKSRDYVDKSLAYDHYDPAYRYGWESRSQHDQETFTQVESHLERDWESRRGNSDLDWQRARPAAEDAWNRVDREYAKQ